ncbi:MAG: hypothetical protein GYA31_01530 [Parcubacteria group bacterium]|nr:hypothetical protein [Parcubacteria group bacterium]
MTIIHEYSSQTRTIILNSSRIYPRHYHNSLRYYVHEFTDYFGHAKTIFLSGALIVLFIAAWLIIFSSNISLDYQISSLKKEIKDKEDKISILQEEAIAAMSDQKILEWAQANGFTKVGNISYLDLSAANLARVDNFNLK